MFLFRWSSSQQTTLLTEFPQVRIILLLLLLIIIAIIIIIIVVNRSRVNVHILALLREQQQPEGRPRTWSRDKRLCAGASSPPSSILMMEIYHWLLLLGGLMTLLIISFNLYDHVGDVVMLMSMMMVTMSRTEASSAHRRSSTQSQSVEKLHR